jgi:hypothetical protein
MKRPFLIASLAVTFLFVLGDAQELSQKRGGVYPNEISSLKLYKGAKWRSIVPYVSTQLDVESILGSPHPISIEAFGWIGGYDDDPEWKIVVFYVGNVCPGALTGRVESICLWPKKRVSLKGVLFSKRFEKSGVNYPDQGIELSVYRDSFGLSYSVYDRDTPDGRIHAGDLHQISYSAALSVAGGC